MLGYCFFGSPNYDSSKFFFGRLFIKFGEVGDEGVLGSMIKIFGIFYSSSVSFDYLFDRDDEMFG